MISSNIDNKKNEKQKTLKLKHDELFRAIISEPKCHKEFFEAHLPNYVKDIIYLDSIKIEKSDFLDEYLKESICDVLFSVKMKNIDVEDKDKISNKKNKAPQIGYLNLLLEAQSKADPKMSFRMMKYMMLIWDRHFKNHPKDKKLPLIFPIIFSNARSNKNMSLDFFDFFYQKDLARKFFTEPFQLIDLNKIPDSGD